MPQDNTDVPNDGALREYFAEVRPSVRTFGSQMRTPRAQPVFIQMPSEVEIEAQKQLNRLREQARASG